MSIGFQEFLTGWFAKPQMKPVYQQEQALLNTALPNLFGFFLVQLGRISNESLCSASRVNHKVLIDHDIPPADPSFLDMDFIQADLDYLPIAKDCVDVLLLPHTLEVAADPHYLLRQVDNMLVPEGHLVILGFNPSGCISRSHKWLTRREPFRGANLEHPKKLKEWLEVLGYDTLSISHSPVGCLSDKKLPFNGFLSSLFLFSQKLLKPFGIQLGNSYCLVAKKRVDSPTLVGVKWRMPRWRAISGKLVSRENIQSKKTLNLSKSPPRKDRQ